MAANPPGELEKGDDEGGTFHDPKNDVSMDNDGYELPDTCSLEPADTDA